MHYRADIDGLRALAVGLVVLHHAGFGFLPGGFVGVDVFFVISGFLITSIIIDRQQQGRFSMGWFLGRRIKRLMPALFVMLGLCSLFFSFVLLPADLDRMLESVVWIVLQLGNVFFWRDYGGYFAANSQEAPFLHTWSLAVEEQYYLIWPLMLVLAMRWLTRRQLLALAVVGCVAATWFSHWGTQVTIGAAYYLLPTRFFELLAGSTLAIAWPQLPRLQRHLREAGALLGLALIIGSAIVLTEHHSFPGLNAIWVVLGSLLLILSQGSRSNALLSTGPCVQLGQMSYSLYLWHWPIFAWFNYRMISPDLPQQLAAIALAIVLAWLSLHLIENPGRRANWSSFGIIARRLYLAPAASLAILASVGMALQGLPGRFGPQVAELERAVQSAPDEYRQDCHSAQHASASAPNPDCLFGQSGSDPEVLLIGDSHANHFVPFLEPLLETAGLTAQDYTLDMCLPVFEFDWGANAHRQQRCRQRNRLAAEYLRDQSFRYVVLAGTWPAYGAEREPRRQQDFHNQLRQTIRTIVASGAQPVIIEDVPSLAGTDPKCPVKRSALNVAAECQVQGRLNLRFQAQLRELQQTVPELLVIRPTAVQCQAGTCSMTVNGTPLYRDNDHLNLLGSRALGQQYLERIGSPFVSNERTLTTAAATPAGTARPD